MVSTAKRAQRVLWGPSVRAPIRVWQWGLRAGSKLVQPRAAVGKSPWQHWGWSLPLTLLSPCLSYSPAILQPCLARGLLSWAHTPWPTGDAWWLGLLLAAPQPSQFLPWGGGMGPDWWGPSCPCLPTQDNCPTPWHRDVLRNAACVRKGGGTYLCQQDLEDIYRTFLHN